MHVCCVKLSEIQTEVVMEDADPVYDEACRLIGQCCLMLAQNGEETNRAQIAYQLKRLHWRIMEHTDGSHLAVKLAIEQLEDSLKR